MSGFEDQRDFPLGEPEGSGNVRPQPNKGQHAMSLGPRPSTETEG